MKRILDENVITEAKTQWEYYVPHIIKQAKMEKTVHIQKKIQEIGITDEDCKTTVVLTMYIHMIMLSGNTPMIATVLLPYLIPDARSKPELEKVLQLSYVSFLNIKVNNDLFCV